jgi:hypothetical protein
MMLEVNSCDYGHETAQETRRLPIGGDAGVIVCEEHYHAEMESRKLAARAGRARLPRIPSVDRARGV